MATLTFKNKYDFRYPEDVEEIVTRMRAMGHTISPNDAEAAWDAYSDSMAAGWMGLPEDDDILLLCMKPYLNMVD